MMNDTERLLNVKEAIERIEKYSQQGEQIFFKEELV